MDPMYSCWLWVRDIKWSVNHAILQKPWWRHHMETISALLALCVGNSPVTGAFPSQRPVTRNFGVSLICAWTNGWVNNHDACDLRRHRAHYDVTVKFEFITCQKYDGTPDVNRIIHKHDFNSFYWHWQSNKWIKYVNLIPSVSRPLIYILWANRRVRHGCAKLKRHPLLDWWYE